MSTRAPEYMDGQSVPGTVYRVVRCLGAGGMGTVYEVEDTSIGKRYVLKTLHAALADRKDLAERLGREARALAKLQHPNIVEVYTSGTTTDALRLPFYVMERLVGSPLRDILTKKGALTPEQAVDIAIDLLDALDHAHEYGIIHRDVKPDNIFICRSRDGRSIAKLLDFGIIKLVSGSAATVQTGNRFIGTLRYAPPEQTLNRTVTPQSDLYAAGLVLYEMLVGHGPFDDFLGEMEIGKAHIDMAPPPVGRSVHVPPPLEKLVMSALEKDPARRPKDAFTFAATLRSIKQGYADGRTVEALVTAPASASRPAAFFATPTSGVIGSEVIPPSDGNTRIDAPQAKHAETTPGAAPPLTKTLALGVVPVPSNVTYAAAPVSGIASIPVDRGAETRTANPPVQHDPSFDTSPIPLRVLAPGPPAETLGPTTTQPSARKRVAVGAYVVPWVGALVLVAGVGMFLIARRLAHAPAVTESAAVAVSPATPQPSVAQTAADSAVMALPALPTAVPNDPVVAASARTEPRRAAPGRPDPAKPDPTHRPETVPPAASTSIPLTHRVGSGL